MNIPQEYGGGGLSAVDTMLVEEQFGHTKDILIRRAFGNVYESLLEGDAAQKERWLLPAVRGERTCSIAITEPGAGSDAAAITTRAEKAGAGYTLNGRKHFISDGLFSDFFIVSAVTDPAARPRHVSLFLVDKNLAGVTIGRDQKMMGLTGTSHVELVFENVRWAGAPARRGRPGTSRSHTRRSAACASPRSARAPSARLAVSRR
jgi:acyl-CoA dehydrogenase